MRVLITDGENRAALAAVRSLGRAGHTVIVGEKHTPSLAQTSRFCSRRIVYPDPISSSDAFIDSLAAIVHQHDIEALLPISDITTFLVTGNRHRFGKSCLVPFAAAETVERAADKVELTRMAMRLGVPTPRYAVVSSPDHVPPNDLDFPVVIKPWRSRIRTPHGWVSTSVSYAVSESELRHDLAARPSHEFPLMLQERIIGPGMGVFACYRNGRPVAMFSHRRLRERPPWGGVSVLSESVPLCPVAREYSLRLLDELRWDGVAMVEFKRDVRHDVPVLKETTGRFWGPLQLAIDAGVDFPAILIDSGGPGPLDRQPPYGVGVRSRWFWGDVDSLLATLRGGRRSLAPVGRLQALGEFVKFWGVGLHYDNPKPDDIWPWIFESHRWFRTTTRDLIRSLPSISQASPAP